MGFWGKISKITSITMMAAGGVVLAGSAAMLGVGANKTYVGEVSMYSIAPYAETTEEGVTPAPTPNPGEGETGGSGNTDTNPGEGENGGSGNTDTHPGGGENGGSGNTDTHPTPNPEGSQKAEIGVGSLNYGKVWINGKYITNIYSGSSYNNFVKEARDALKALGDNPGNKNELDLYRAIVQANDLMIAGAVLTTISSLVLIAGIVIFCLARMLERR